MTEGNEQEISLYEGLGGEAGVRALVREFYRLMDTLPETQGIRAMHPDLAVSEEKLFAFLSGWTGGPQLYIEKYGHPRLRMRHFPFPIGGSERDQWMLCMDRALAASALQDPYRSLMSRALYRLADHMRNKPQENS